MSGPRSAPTPASELLLGWVLFAGSLVVAGTGAFVAGVAICRRWWP